MDVAADAAANSASPLPERAIGIAAHDFAQAIGAPEVALTRAARREGVPTVPSRWLLRLDAVLRAAGLDGALGPDDPRSTARRGADRSRRALPAAAAARAAPAARGAAATSSRSPQIETWLRDPYAIYARHILRLRALDELDADPGRAELGTVIHEALDEFVRRYPAATCRTMPRRELLRDRPRAISGRMLSRPGAWAFWWPRFERIARWFVAEERAPRRGIVESVSEVRGQAGRSRRPAGPFTITAKRRPHRPPRRRRACC